MKTIKILLGAVALALMSSQAFAAGATGTPLAAVTPSAKQVDKKVGASANFLSHFASYDCTVDPASMAASDTTVATCTIIGVTTDDRVLVSNAASADAATSWCAVPVAAWVSAADTIKFRLLNVGGATCDMASTAYQLLIYKPNTKAD